MQYNLSVCIPARNEQWLKNTVEDLIAHKSATTEIIVGLDGEWSSPPLVQHPDVTIIYHNKSVGQRALTNDCVKISKAKYIIKVDAHCAFDQDFDTKLIADMQDNWTVFPIMKNLHVFDWVCKNGHRRYQGPSGVCTECGEPTERDVLWNPKKSPNSTSFCFDPSPHFQYDNDRKKTKEYLDGAIVGYNLFIDPSFTSSDLLEEVMSNSIGGSQPPLVPSVISLLADFANSHKFSGGADPLGFGKDVPVDTVGLPSVNSSGGVGVGEVKVVGDEAQVGGITTSPVPTDMVNNGDILSPSSRNLSNEPSVDQSVRKYALSEVGAPSITTSVDFTSPVPTTRRVIHSNLINELNSILGGEFVYNEKTNRFHNGSVALETINNKDLTESMSLQGSFFLCTREKYWELNMGDETFGSWGSQGIQIAVSTWLSGGRVICNHKTWYAHLFRTQGADFSFPYPQSNTKVQEAKRIAGERLRENKWPHQIYPSSWLIERFLPIPGWKDEDLKKLKELETPSQ